MVSVGPRRPSFHAGSLIIVLMFVGRVGPLTVALAVVAQTSTHTRRPRQRVPVG